jgi:DNA invertase Pin-like site-specific DNA recombinase
MIVRNINGELIKINKYDYANDTIYYEKIMNIKKEFTKERLCEEDVVQKATTFFSRKKVAEKLSSSLHTISNFINIQIN